MKKKRLKVVKSDMSINEIRRLFDIDAAAAEDLKKIAEGLAKHGVEVLGPSRSSRDVG